MRRDPGAKPKISEPGADFQKQAAKISYAEGKKLLDFRAGTKT
jgi:hypothetical protein